MEALRFTCEGLFNSFRIPFFRTYHKSLLAPPKSTILGMLCNISQKSQGEFLELLNQEIVRTSVVVLDLKGKAKDLWSYRVFEKKNRGKSVIRRDKLFGTRYLIYVSSEDEELLDTFYKALLHPKSIPSLGLDDEMIVIENVAKTNLEAIQTRTIHSIFIDEGKKFQAKLQKSQVAVELPTFHQIPVKFDAFDTKGKRKPREVVEFVRQVEFFNCFVEFDEEIEAYKEQDGEYHLIFY